MSKIFIDCPKVYSYNGVLFEVHLYCGPWPLKKNGELKKLAGEKFFNMYEEFSKLTESEKSAYLLYDLTGVINEI